MKKFISTLWAAIRQPVGNLCLLLAFALVLSVCTNNALATDDDITTVTTSLAGYWTAAKAIAIGVLLFLIGRRIVRKI